MKICVVIVFAFVGILISCIKKEPTCTDAAIMEMVYKDTSSVKYVDGYCMDESHVVFLKQRRSELGGEIGVVEIGFFNSEYHAERTFTIDSSFYVTMSSVAVHDSTLYVGTTVPLLAIDLKRQKTNALADLLVSIRSFESNKCINDTLESFSVLHPVDMAVINDSILIDYSKLDFPLSPIIGRIIFDKEMRPSVYFPDSFCLIVKFPNGQELKQGTCTADAWLKLHKETELPIVSNDSCMEMVFHSPWKNYKLDTNANAITKEQFDSIADRMQQKFDSLSSLKTKDSSYIKKNDEDDWDFNFE